MPNFDIEIEDSKRQKKAERGRLRASLISSLFSFVAFYSLVEPSYAIFSLLWLLTSAEFRVESMRWRKFSFL